MGFTINCRSDSLDATPQSNASSANDFTMKPDQESQDDTKLQTDSSTESCNDEDGSSLSQSTGFRVGGNGLRGRGEQAYTLSTQHLHSERKASVSSEPLATGGFVCLSEMDSQTSLVKFSSEKSESSDFPSELGPKHCVSEPRTGGFVRLSEIDPGHLVKFSSETSEPSSSSKSEPNDSSSALLKRPAERAGTAPVTGSRGSTRSIQVGRVSLPGGRNSVSASRSTVGSSGLDQMDVRPLTKGEALEILLRQIKAVQQDWAPSLKEARGAEEPDKVLSVEAAFAAVIGLLGSLKRSSHSDHLLKGMTLKRIQGLALAASSKKQMASPKSLAPDSFFTSTALDDDHVRRRSRSASTIAAQGTRTTNGYAADSVVCTEPFRAGAEEERGEDDGDEEKEPFCFVNPSNPLRIAWDVTSLCIVLADSVIMPFEMAYRSNAPENAWFWIGTTFFFCDIILNFFTGFVAGPLEKDHGQLVTSHKRIAKGYLKSWFIIDFASTVPWAWLVVKIVGTNSESAGSARMAKIAKIAKLARFMRLARMLKLLKLQSLWENFENLIGSMFVVQVFQLLKVLILIVYLSHWNACIWWAVGNPDSLFHDSTDAPWDNLHWTTILHTQKVSGPDGSEEVVSFRWLDRGEKDSYLFCFYWTFGVMRTMPVEVYPVNLSERVYTLCFMFFALSVFSICITKITQMWNKIHQRRSDMDDNIAELREYMRDIAVEKSLQERIRSCLEHKFMKRRFLAREALLLEELSDSHKAEVCFAKVGRIMQQAKLADGSFLFRGIPHGELVSIVVICKTVDAAPGDVISQRGAIAKCAWFVVSGTLTELDPAMRNLRSHREGEQTEEIIAQVDPDCLLYTTKTTSEYSYWANDFSELIMIDKTAFLEVRKMQPELDRHFQRLLAKTDSKAGMGSLTGENFLSPDHGTTQGRRKRADNLRAGNDSRMDAEDATNGAVVSAVG